jgi:hypothetical protein
LNLSCGWGGVPEFIAAIKEQKNKITAPELAALKKLAISNISIIGDGLKLKPGSRAVSRGSLSDDDLMPIPQIYKNEIAAVNIINIMMLTR